RLEAGCPGGFLLETLGNVGAFRIVLEVSVEADSEEVPGRSAFPNEDGILGPPQALQVGVLHFALAAQVAAPTRQDLEHLHMEDTRLLCPRAKLFDRRPLNEDVFLPGDQVPQSGERLRNRRRLLASCDPF